MSHVLQIHSLRQGLRHSLKSDQLWAIHEHADKQRTPGIPALSGDHTLLRWIRGCTCRRVNGNLDVGGGADMIDCTLGTSPFQGFKTRLSRKCVPASRNSGNRSLWSPGVSFWKRFGYAKGPEP